MINVLTTSIKKHTSASQQPKIKHFSAVIWEIVLVIMLCLFFYTQQIETLDCCAKEQSDFNNRNTRKLSWERFFFLSYKKGLFLAITTQLLLTNLREKQCVIQDLFFVGGGKIMLQHFRETVLCQEGANLGGK